MLEFSEFVYSVRKLREILRDRPDVLDRDEPLDELVEEIEQQLDEYTPYDDGENIDYTPHDDSENIDTCKPHEDDENLDI